MEMEKDIALVLVLIILAFWKFIDVVLWVLNHIRISYTS